MTLADDIFRYIFFLGPLRVKLSLPLFSAMIIDVFLKEDFDTAEISAENAHSLSVLLTSWTVATSRRLLRLQRKSKTTS